jgi:hypothetical protein
LLTPFRHNGQREYFGLVRGQPGKQHATHRIDQTENARLGQLAGDDMGIPVFVLRERARVDGGQRRGVKRAGANDAARILC